MKSQFTTQQFIEVFEVVPCSTRRQLQEWVVGVRDGRHYRTEKVLYQLQKIGRVFAVKHDGNTNVYFDAKRYKPNRTPKPHDMAVTECMLASYKATGARILPERKVRGHGIKPDWVVEFENGARVYGEYFSKDNAQRKYIFRQKVQAYSEYLIRFPHECRVLFVLALPRLEIKDHYEQLEGEVFYLTDYETFVNTRSFSWPIYFWRDGFCYPLIDNGTVVYQAGE